MNPATENLKQCILDEFRLYNNLAPKTALLFYSLFFFGYLIYEIYTSKLLDLSIVETLSASFKYACIFAAIGYAVGRIFSLRLQSNQLQLLQRERLKRRKALKKQLQMKREALNKLEAMMS